MHEFFSVLFYVLVQTQSYLIVHPTAKTKEGHSEALHQSQMTTFCLAHPGFDSHRWLHTRSLLFV